MKERHITGYEKDPGINYFAPVGSKVNEQRIITKGRETKWTNYEMDSDLFEDFQKELRTLIPNARCTQKVEIEGDKFIIEGEHCKVVLTFEDNGTHHMPNDSYRYQIQIYNNRLTLSEAWIGTTKQEFDRDKADVIKYFTETNWEEALDNLREGSIMKKVKKLNENTDPFTIAALVAYVGLMGATLVGLGRATSKLVQSALDKAEEAGVETNPVGSITSAVKGCIEKLRNKLSGTTSQADKFGLTPEELDALDVIIDEVVSSKYMGIATNESLTWAVLSRVYREQPEMYHKLTHLEGSNPLDKDAFNYALSKTSTAQYNKVKTLDDETRLKLYNKGNNKVIRNKFNQELKSEYGIKGLSNSQYNRYIRNNFTEARVRESKNLKESTQEERDQRARDLIESPYNNLQEEDFEWLREKDETLDYWWNQTCEMEFMERSLYDGPIYENLDESKEVSFEFSNNADADEFIDDVKARYHYPALRSKHDVDRGGTTPSGGKVYFKGAIARLR